MAMVASPLPKEMTDSYLFFIDNPSGDYNSAEIQYHVKEDNTLVVRGQRYNSMPKGFTHYFKLPEDANTDEISALYLGDHVLIVAVKKLVRSKKPRIIKAQKVEF